MRSSWAPPPRAASRRPASDRLRDPLVGAVVPAPPTPVVDSGAPPTRPTAFMVRRAVTSASIASGVTSPASLPPHNEAPRTAVRWHGLRQETDRIFPHRPASITNRDVPVGFKCKASARFVLRRKLRTTPFPRKHIRWRSGSPLTGPRRKSWQVTLCATRRSEPRLDFGVPLAQVAGQEEAPPGLCVFPRRGLKRT